MPSLGGPEPLIVLAVVLLLFGSTHLPGLARSIGQASREFRRGADGGAHRAWPGAPTERHQSAAAGIVFRTASVAAARAVERAR